MKTGTIKYSQEFRSIEGSRWIGIELQYDMSSETPGDVYKEAERLVHSFANTSGQPILDNSPAPGPPPVITIERTSEAERDAELIRNIYACTQLTGNDGLQTFYTVAQKSEAGKMAYDVMKRKLVKIESDELLAKSKLDNGPLK